MFLLKFLVVGVFGIIFHLNSFSDSLKYKRQPSFYDSLPNVVKKGTLYFKMMSDPKVMNPILATDAESTSVEGYLWMPLMNLDPESLQFLPALASEYIISPDKKNYTFKLNPKAKWQDGTDVTAQDYKFTFEKIVDPKINAAVQRSSYDGIELIINDQHTLTFHAKEPRFNTLFVVASFITIQKKQFEHSTDFNNDPGILHPVGNGPYTLVKYERGNKIVFSRNKQWWGNSLPHLKNSFNIDNITVKIIADQNLSYEKFINGDIDQITFTSEQWHIKVTGLDKSKFSFTPSPQKKIWALKADNKFPKPFNYIGWNEKNPFFKSVKTRTALSYLVNYKKIIEKVYYNLQIQCTSPFGSLSLNSAPDLREESKMISFNKKKAMELLKEDGWKNGGAGILVKNFEGKNIPFVFNLNVPSQSQERQKIAQILKEDFKMSGIVMNIKSIEWNSFLDKLEKRNFDAVIVAWTASLFPDAKQIWHTHSQGPGGSNFISYSNPNLDSLIQKSNLEFDTQKRNLIMQEMNRIIYTDQPYTFLTEPMLILEGLNTKIKSPKWLSQYDSGTAADLFYLD